MKQVLVRRGDVMIEEVPAPIVSDKTVLVRTAYSVISTGTEMSVVSSSGASIIDKLTSKPELARKGWESLRTQGIKKTLATATGRDQIALPLGYSLSGVVVETGRGVTGIKPGDKVACAGAGLANHAEYVSVPQNLIRLIPKNVSLKDASTITLGTIALQGVRQADLRLGETVCVSGLGLLGLLTVQLVKAGGCRVIGIDPDGKRRSLAMSMGADNVCPLDDRMLQAAIDSITGGHGADATIVTAATSSNGPINQAMQLTRKKGTVVIVGAVGLKLSRSPFYEKEIDLKISCSYGPGRYDSRYEMEGEDYPYAYVRWTENRNMDAYLDLIAQSKLDLSFVTQHEFAIADAQNAYVFLGESSGEALAAILKYDTHPDDHITDQRSLSLTKARKTTEGTIGVGLIGAGSFAVGMHLPNLAKLSGRSTLQCVTDMNGVTAREIGSRFGATKVSTDPETVFGDKTIDMVMICTRHDSHADLIVRGLEAHKAVFVEKPMALNSDQLATVMAAVEQSDGKLVVGFNRRFSPLIMRIMQLLKNRTAPMIIDYQMNAGYLPSDHWTQQAAGGGRNIGEACHIYDLFTYLCNSQVEKISATSIRPTGSTYGSTDNFVASIRFTDGTVGNLTYTSMGTQKYPKEQMNIYCGGMVISLDDYRELKVFGTETKVLRLKKADKGHSELLKRFVASVNTGEESPIPIWQLRQATEISFEIETQLHT